MDKKTFLALMKWQRLRLTVSVGRIERLIIQWIICCSVEVEA